MIADPINVFVSIVSSLEEQSSVPAAQHIVFVSLFYAIERLCCVGVGGVYCLHSKPDLKVVCGSLHIFEEAESFG